MAEGELPEKLAAMLPQGLMPCASLQLIGAPGNMQGALTMEFVLSGGCAGLEAEPELLCLAQGGWTEVPGERISAPGEAPRFRAEVPQSTHYVIAVRK